VLHPGMTGTVAVKDKASGSPSSRLAEGRREMAAIFKAGQAAYANWNPERKGNDVAITLPGNVKEGWSNFRFSRQPLVIKRGTTVTWTVTDPLEIHTVTFTGGARLPDFVVVEAQKQGPPKLLVNPKAAAPSQSKTYDGKGWTNSGLLFPAGAPGNPPSSFSLTFTKVGRYDYACIIHAPWGMKGTVIVQ
jgi:plastocyanin